MTHSERTPAQEGFLAKAHPADAIDPDSDPLEDDELSALSGGNDREAIALVHPQEEAFILANPQSL